MRELTFIRAGRLEWREHDAVTLRDPGDAIVRPFVTSKTRIGDPAPRSLTGKDVTSPLSRSHSEPSQSS